MLEELKPGWHLMGFIARQYCHGCVQAAQLMNRFQELPAASWIQVSGIIESEQEQVRSGQVNSDCRGDPGVQKLIQPP